MENDKVQAVYETLRPVIEKVAEYVKPGSKIEMRYENGVVVKLEF